MVSERPYLCLYICERAILGFKVKQLSQQVKRQSQKL